MQHTFYFYLSIFVKKECYFYAVTLGDVPLDTHVFASFLFSRDFRQKFCHMTLFHQSNVARQSHDTTQNLLMVKHAGSTMTKRMSGQQ